jgi:general secretion pathway protein G
MRKGLNGRLRAARGVARRGQRGMTLLEIMIVIAILGLLASVIVVAVINNFDRAKVNTAELKRKSIEQALHQYNVAIGDYPSQQEGLRMLQNPPSGPPFINEEPKDPWGNEFLYFNPPRKGNGPFEVISKGPDGQEGTDDDIGGGK